MSETAEAALKDWEREDKQLRQVGERFAGDVRWLASQKELREELGLKSLQPGVWYSPSDLQAIVDRARSKPDVVKDLLNCSIENLSDGQVIGELYRQIGLELDEQWVTPEGGGKRYKERRINQQSWEQAWQFVCYRQSLKVQPEPEAAITIDHPFSPIADHPPGHSFSEASRGGDQRSSSEQPVLAASSPAAEVMPTDASVVPEPFREVVQAIEACQSFKQFLRIGQDVFKGKAEEFCRTVIQFLSLSSRHRVLIWVGQSSA